ncbi:MAG: putative zinc-binding protein [Paraglaciecola sp.]|nr:putative zinc-binding protein [Paraglaciecola sp.]
MNAPYHTELPLIVTCSGQCENAKFANDLAKVMDIEGLAERTSVSQLSQAMKQAMVGITDTPRVMAIDGCDLHCVKKALNLSQIAPTWHIILSDFTENSRKQSPFDYAHMANVLKTVQCLLTASN